ncbi:RHS repeat-associated core domain-containing protein, partial [Burkholderia cenocepacia]|uniref:RHS repeat-associated core domain-containing protein n=1 Tax=Burkholderia cenocepacia TaxID=95486 RepID=UPI002AB71B06
DEHSEIAWSAEYRAWGVAKEALRKASDGRVELRNPIRFQGQYHDQETGLHYNRHRYYDPNSGRFVSKDPIGLAGGLNAFQYAPNPISWIDPFGLSAASDLPRMKGRSVPRVGSVLNDAGFAKTKDNGVNETWKHADGSEVRVHKYGNKCPCPYRSGNNAHVHKEDPAGNQLNDRGLVSLDPNETHIGIRNPADLPAVRGRPHGS